MTNKQRQKMRIVIYNVIILLLVVIVGILGIYYYAQNNDGTIPFIEPKVIDPFEVNIEQSEIDNSKLTPASEINVYGETINIALANDDYDHKYTLVSTATKEASDSYQMSDKIDTGIGSNDLPIGSYILRLEDGSYLSYKGDLNISFNTITRDGKSNPISITSDHKLVHIVKNKAITDNTETDILIDPGHGGADGGSTSLDGTVYESELNLEVATILANKLTAMGYNVKMTRTDDTQPGESADEVNAYSTGGRVTQVYDDKAKLSISVHHNKCIGCVNQGFEIYTSVYSSNHLAQLISENLQTISPISNLTAWEFSPGVHTRTYDDEGITQDYLYQIRETGGIATKSTNDKNKPNNQNLEGAEAVLVEFGYVDNDSDLVNLDDPDFQDQEAQQVADAIDSYLKTENPGTLSSETSQTTSEQ